MEPHSVTLLDLQTDGAVILQRVRAGELLVVTLDGEPMAELRPLAAQGLCAAETIRRAKDIPVIDYAQFRADLDAVLDPRLFPE